MEIISDTAPARSFEINGNFNPLIQLAKITRIAFYSQLKFKMTANNGIVETSRVKTWI
jgi:hypothetical protein